MNRSVVRLPGPNDPSIDDIRNEQDEHSALRLVWLMFAGWWLSALWLAIAWLSILLVVTMPLGLRMIARLPSIVFLKAPEDIYDVIVSDTLERIENTHSGQRRFILRLLYCLAVGWWLSMGWTGVAWWRGLSLQKLPDAVLMLMRLPAIMTLRRY